MGNNEVKKEVPKVKYLSLEQIQIPQRKKSIKKYTIIQERYSKKILEWLMYKKLLKKQKILTQEKLSVLHKLFNTKLDDRQKKKIENQKQIKIDLKSIYEDVIHEAMLHNEVEIPELIKTLDSLESLEIQMQKHFEEITSTNEINFYDKFIQFLKEKKSIVDIRKNDSYLFKNNNTINSNLFISSKGRNSLSKYKNLFAYGLSKTHFFGFSFAVNNEADKNLFEDEIRKLIEFTKNYNPWSIKNNPTDEANPDKVSYLLLLYMKPNLINDYIFLRGETRLFVKKYFYLYSMLKGGYIDNTKEFVAINTPQIYHTLNDPKYYVFHSADDTINKNNSSLLDISDNSNNRIKTENESEFENKGTVYYNGDYDKTTYLFAGRGNLIDVSDNSEYEGMFRYNKKNGIGIYKKFEKNEKEGKSYLFTYSGEWLNDYMHGYGIYIKTDTYTKNQNILIKKVTIQIGQFKNNSFCSGTEYIYIKNERNLTEKEKMNIIFDIDSQRIEKVLDTFEYIKKEGEFDENTHLAEGYGIKKHYIYTFNFLKQQSDLEEYYIYNGDFINDLENGQGELKKYSKNSGFTYEYKGGFKDGKMNGFGHLKYDDDYYIKKYEGFFKMGNKFDNYGIVEFRSGDIYEGFFDDDFQKSGIGLYQHFSKENFLKDCDNFFGYFKNDKKNGIGKYTSTISCKTLFGKYSNGEKYDIFSLVCDNKIGFESDISGNSFNLFVDKSKQEFTRLATGKKRLLRLFDNSISKISTDKNMVESDDSIKQNKIYILFEKGEVIETSENKYDLYQKC